MGENIDKLPREVLKKHNEINWRKYYAFRNSISHTYNDILIEVIADLISELPVLKRAIVKIKREIKWNIKKHSKQEV